MNQPRLDALEPKRPRTLQEPPPHEQRKKKNIWKVLFFVLVACSVVLATITSKTISSENFFGGIAHLPLIRDVAQWTAGIENKLRASDDRINVLLLGMAGSGHEGALLTDTIIFASFDPDTDHVALVSIPRDLYVPVPDRGMLKINAANAYGEQDKYPGGGAALASKVVEDIFDQDIDYYVRIDFSGFEKIVDMLGGIEVYVERSFTDSQYPTDNSLTKTISFEQGWQTMDGQRSLQFVRSRHGSGGEGSDFARSKRQQKILTAIRNKVLSLKILLNPKKIGALIQELSDNIQTNVKPWELSDLLKIANKSQGKNVTNIVLDDSPDGYLAAQNTPETGFILVPRDGDFSQIQDMISNLHIGGKIELENAKVFLLNGTSMTGLARLEQTKLSRFQITVVGMGTSPDQHYAKTVIYDLSDGKKDVTLKFLKNHYRANVTKKIPEILSSSTDPDVQTAINPDVTDFLVVLGQE